MLKNKEVEIGLFEERKEERLKLLQFWIVFDLGWKVDFGFFHLEIREIFRWKRRDGEDGYMGMVMDYEGMKCEIMEEDWGERGYRGMWLDRDCGVDGKDWGGS